MNDTHSIPSTLHEVHSLIHAPAETVFEILSQVASWHIWQPDVRVLCKGEPLHEGSRFKYSDTGIVINSEVTEFQPFHMIAWKSRSLWMTAEVRFTLEQENGNTLLHYEQELQGFGALLFMPMVRRSMDLLIAQLAKYTSQAVVPVYS